MSYEPTVYARGATPTVDAVRTALRARGWELALGEDPSAPELGDGIVLAWRVGALTDDDRRQVDRGLIQPLLNRGVLASVELSVDAAFASSDLYDEEELEELADALGPDHVEGIRTASLAVTTRSNASCGPLTVDFHPELCEVLVALTGGFLAEE